MGGRWWKKTTSWITAWRVQCGSASQINSRKFIVRMRSVQCNAASLSRLVNLSCKTTALRTSNTPEKKIIEGQESTACPQIVKKVDKKSRSRTTNHRKQFVQAREADRRAPRQMMSWGACPEREGKWAVNCFKECVKHWQRQKGI